jgi:thiosulfate/3-mercaptopyruvate sulfurtransferase
MKNLSSLSGRATRYLRGTAILALTLGLQVASAKPLLTPAELAAQLAGNAAPRVIDIRANRDATGKTAYEAGHIAGSLPAPYPQWRGSADNPGQLPAHEELVALMQSLGIDANTPVVVVYEGADGPDFGAAARVYWTLKTAGVRDLAILNGGLIAWRQAGLPLTKQASAPLVRSRYDFVPDPKLIATRAEIQHAIVARDELLLDARPASFFKGEAKSPVVAIPGTIAGAANLDNGVWFAGDSGALADAATLRQLAVEHGVVQDGPIVSFCNTGHLASTNWFVLSEVLGNPNVKLYPESMTEWSRSGGAMDHVPGRLQQFAQQLKTAVGTH